MTCCGRPIAPCTRPSARGAIASSRPTPFRLPSAPERTPETRTPPGRAASQEPGKAGLLDLAFLEIDVLAHDGVVFAQGQLLGVLLRVFLRHVIEPGIRRADELDPQLSGFSHGLIRCFNEEIGAGPYRPGRS